MTEATRERPILFSGPMVRALLEGRKTQTRRVVKVPPHITPDGLMPMTWERHDASLREQGVADDARPYLTGPRWDGERLFGNLRGDIGYGVIACPYGAPGDRLWVRETFQYESRTEDFEHDVRNCIIRYRATEPDAGPWIDAEDNETTAWRPSIHMPRSASRLTLEVTGVRVERVQDIAEEDVSREGVGLGRPAFRALWDSLNGGRGHGWDTNPWVWVIEFKRLRAAA